MGERGGVRDREKKEVKEGEEEEEERKRGSSGRYFLCGWMGAGHTTGTEAALGAVEEVMKDELSCS